MKVIWGVKTRNKKCFFDILCHQLVPVPVPVVRPFILFHIDQPHPLQTTTPSKQPAPEVLVPTGTSLMVCEGLTESAPKKYSDNKVTTW